jgi:tripartite-type tricarboxylate transporter receptor subunit TctC
MERWVHRTGGWLGAVFAAAAASAACAQAPAYPAKPVRLLVPFAAGGATDVPTRILATKLAERMGSPFIIDNRPGAGGAIGTATVARAEPDGYSVLVTATPFVVTPMSIPSSATTR